MLTYSLEMFLSCCHGDTCFVIDLKALQYRAPFISQTCRDSLIFDVVCTDKHSCCAVMGAECHLQTGPFFVLDRLEPEQPIGLQKTTGSHLGCCDAHELLWIAQVSAHCHHVSVNNSPAVASLVNLSWTFREGLYWLLERVMDTVRRCSLWLMFELCFSFTVYWSK